MAFFFLHREINLTLNLIIKIYKNYIHNNKKNRKIIYNYHLIIIILLLLFLFYLNKSNILIQFKNFLLT